ncbi:hypothetical protein RBH94_15090 [Aestuariibaculum sp. YM273]|uniref:hypothetical protein n=1 Tax=Aestuariibaculum sp. YM273 TaxID=3070659 RepID=UPI0027DC46FD|nr:hypothetical protein [Aestuariibaculum sp. YM273]WMI65376.1 hypothetical protein RBH94_15090 [Aestuariibaculum sp. YM273]
MAVLVNITTKAADVLEWGEEYSPEQEEYIQHIIGTFENKLEDYLKYKVSGYYQINAEFEYNPITNKFKLLECDSLMVHHIHNALRTELKQFT